ncbi:hypothetical protein [Streptomyces fractus]
MGRGPNRGIEPNWRIAWWVPRAAAPVGRAPFAPLSQGHAEIVITS